MRLLAAALVAAVVLAGCGGGGGSGDIKVSAAASLSRAFPRIDPNPSYQFAGSDVLAAQIRAGARPDVYAAANTKLPAALAAAGLVERPTPFATNRLVLAVPANSSRVRGVADLTKPGVRIAIGSATVPIGSYTRQVLVRLGPATARAVLANVRSSEPDVSGVVGKLTQGAVDAGFVYASDVAGASGKLRAIELPPRAQPRVVYAVAVVKGARHAAAARAFVGTLTTPAAQAQLREAGFGTP